MFSKIVVGAYGGGADALRLAKSLAADEAKLILADAPAELALCDLAASEKADLIVAGAQSGSDLLRESSPLPCPLALAPPGHAEVTDPTPLAVVTHDGSERSWRALRLALRLAGDDCPVLVV